MTINHSPHIAIFLINFLQYFSKLIDTLTLRFQIFRSNNIVPNLRWIITISIPTSDNIVCWVPLINITFHLISWFFLDWFINLLTFSWWWCYIVFVHIITNVCSFHFALKCVLLGFFIFLYFCNINYLYVSDLIF